MFAFLQNRLYLCKQLNQTNFMKRTHTNLDEIIALKEVFEEAKIRGITFREQNVLGKAFDDFVQQFFDGNDTPHINILEGMTCERDKDWLDKQLED